MAGEISFLNHSAQALIGLQDGDDLKDLGLSDLYPAWAARIIQSEALPAAARTGVWKGETAVKTRAAVIPVSQVIVPHRDDQSDVTFFSSIARDISERKTFESRLIELANHDSLTGLFNRRRFVEEVELEISRAKRSGASGGLLFLDIDGSKFINDALGHRVGDRLLIELAETLKATVRDADVVARIGGDEFSVLLPDTSIKELTLTASRVLEAVRNIRLANDEQFISVTASIGACTYPGDGQNAESLLARLDMAMYSAKLIHDSVRLYDDSSLADYQSSGSRLIDQQVRWALENDGLLLYAQPICNLNDGGIRWEILSRILLPDGDMLLPGSFLPTLERSGLIHAFDRAVVNETLDYLELEALRDRQVCFSINLSGKAFDDAELLPIIQRRLSENRVRPESITFEVTETAAISNIVKAQEFIQALRDLGCKFAIDDFGVGLSSYYYLKNLPADYLKIDGSFIRNLKRDAADQHRVKSIVEMARGLGKKTVAEYVGDQATMVLLRDLGVDDGQGFYLGEPEALVDLFSESWLQKKVA